MPQLTEEQFLEITNLHTPKKFEKGIEILVMRDGIGYIDAIMEYSVEHGIDYDIIPKLITKSLKDKLEAEAIEFNFLPKVGILPV